MFRSRAQDKGEGPDQNQMRAAIASCFSFIHDTVSQFSRRMLSEMKRYNYVTPTNFLELVSGYKQYAHDV